MRGVKRGQPARELTQGIAEPRNVAHPARDRFFVVPRRATADALPPVGHSRGVGGGRAIRHIPGSHVLEEVAPRHELHREEPAPLVEHELPELYEVRVARLLRRAELLLEAHERIAIERAHRLQRDMRLPLGVERLVDEPHPPFAQRADDRVALGAQLHGRLPRILSARAP